MQTLILASEAPPVTSGVARTIEHLQRELTACGHAVEVRSTADAPRAHFGEFRLSALAAKWRSTVPDLASFDVINLHGPLPFVTELILRDPRARNQPIVYTHHFDLELEGLQRATGVYNRIVRRAARRSASVIATTDDYRDELRRSGIERCTTIPWATDVPATTDPTLFDGTGPLRVLFVGQLRPYKGAAVLVDALGGVDGVHVTIGGSGPQEDELRLAAQRHKNIDVIGRVPDADLIGVYDEHHVVVLPSINRLEAFGLVLLEGMRRGCVPVGSDLPGVRSVASPTGVCAAPGNAAALRTAITGLRDDPTGTARSQQASIEHSSTFRWDRTGAEYDRVLREAAGRAR